MAKKILSLPSMSRVTPNSTAILEIPVGPTYHHILFNASGTALAISHFGGVRVLIDGNEYQRFASLQDLIDLNAYYAKSADTATEWMLHFKCDEYDALEFRRAPGFGTADVKTMTIEIDILAGAPANVAMSAMAFLDTARQPLGVYQKVRLTPFSSASAGDVVFDKLNRGGIVYQAIHLFKSDITKAVMEVDGTKIVDSSKTNLERLEKNCWPRARVPLTAKATHLDFLLQGDASDLLNTQGVQDLRLTMTLGTSGSINIYTEEIAVHVPVAA